MLLAAVTRVDVANYVSALFSVYILLIFVYILLNLLFSFGVRLPYSRWSDALMNFLRDVCEPYLRDLPTLHPANRDVRPDADHRHLPALHRADDRRQRDRRLSHVPQAMAAPVPASSRVRTVALARAAAVVGAVLVLDIVTKHTVATSTAAEEGRSIFLGVRLVHVRNRGVAFGFLSGGGVPFSSSRSSRLSCSSPIC